MLIRFLRLPLTGLMSAGALLWLGADITQAASVVHGAWSVDCKYHSDTNKTSCVASQKVATDPLGKKVVLGVIVEPVEDAARSRIMFRMSKKAYKPAGIGIKIDDRPPSRLKINACDENICEARGWLTEELLGQMRGGRLMRFAFFVDPTNQITYPVSLNGFDSAFKVLRRTD